MSRVNTPECTHVLSPHKRLLLAATSLKCDLRQYPEIKAILADPQMDWAAALPLSTRHGVSQQLAAFLAPFSNDTGIPAAVNACLSRMLRANARRNAVMLREAGRLMQGLQAAGVRSMLLKGGALALTVYPDVALRNFADIDILVDVENYERAGETAEQLGYTFSSNREDPLVHNCRYERSCEEDILTDTLPIEFDSSLRPEIIAPCCRQVTVEIHRGTFRDAMGYWRAEKMAPFWEQALTVSLPEGQPALIPPPEAMMVHLCAHAAGHCFRRLMFMADIAQVIRCYGPSLHWERILHLAQHYGESANVYRCLQFVHHELHVPVPPDILKSLLACSPRHLCMGQLSAKDIFAMMDENDSYARILQRWCLAPNQRLRFAVLLRMLAPPASQMRRRYGHLSRVGLAYQYLARLFRVTHRVARVLMRCVFGRIGCSSPTSRKTL